MIRQSVLSGLCAVLLLQGCAETPLGPTVQVMPPPTKPFEIFQQDDASCRQFSTNQVAGQAERENNRAVGAAFLGTVLGAGLGAAVGGGRGAAIGAGSGAIVGTGVGAGGSGATQGSIQQQYDIAYSQCMYSKGNIVPGAAPAYPGAAPGYPGAPSY